MAVIMKELIRPKKLARTLKRQLLNRLPWINKFERVPATHQHQEEVDENAINEALEARLMELIAAAPVAKEHVTLTIKAVVPANLDALDTAVLASLKTRFQAPEPQQPAASSSASEE